MIHLVQIFRILYLELLEKFAFDRQHCVQVVKCINKVISIRSD
jgi:hypothetical protein